MIVHLFGYSDQTHFTNYSSDNKEWPLYWSLGNIDSTSRSKPSNPACIPVALLPVPLECHCKRHGKQLPRRTNKSTIERFQGRSASEFFLLSTDVSTLIRLCFVRMVGCGDVILSSVHGRLTPLISFTSIQSSSPIALYAKHSNHRLERGNRRHGNCETIDYASKRWYSRLREMRRWDNKQAIICRIARLEPRMASSAIWNASLQQL